MVPPTSCKVPRVSQYFGSRSLAIAFMYGAFTLSGRTSQSVPLANRVTCRGPLPQHARTLVWAPSISLAATLEIDVSFFSSGYLDVSVHRVPDVWLWIYHTTTEVCSARFPHSDTHGSMDICSSPWLFAAYHVFLRLLVPRHPPCALSSLTSLAQCIALHRLVVFLFLVFSDVLIKIFLSFSRFIQYAVFKVRS